MNDLLDLSIGTYWMTMKKDGLSTNTEFYTLDSYTKGGAPRLIGIENNKIFETYDKTMANGHRVQRPNPEKKTGKKIPTHKSRDGFYRANGQYVWKCDTNLTYQTSWHTNR